MDEWINKMYYILGWSKSLFGFFHTILRENPDERFGQFSTYKSEILIHATTQMNLGSILSEIKQTPEDNYCMIQLIWGT